MTRFLQTAMHAFMLSAAHKSSGKTSVSIGLCAALASRGMAVQPFKKGPDYIDPMWHARAAGRPCYNLDPYLASAGEICRAWRQRAAGADVCLVEGNMGLHDGLALDGSNSNAALAAMLDLPVILVIDARGMTRGIAPLVLGYQAFDPNIRIAGVILNRIAGQRHESKLRAALDHYTTIPVLGAIPETPELAIDERHLGLVPSSEADDAAERIDRLRQAVAAHVDIERLLALTASAASAPAPIAPLRRKADLRIGIARDAAFGFYYAEDLDALRDAGAELVPFDTLRDQHLPAVDGLFIGGGFPEVMAAELAANVTLRAELCRAIEGGLPVYAECGGLMYLSRSITWQGQTHAMVGAIPADAVMQRKAAGRGYVDIEATADHPWLPVGAAIRAHEFHYSTLINAAPGLRHAWRVQRGHGIDGRQDGIVHHNMLAAYSHLRSLPGCEWPTRFVAFVRQCAAAKHAAEPLAACA
ncbi:MAG: cobyrinate a,c-diamide synthase [Azonexus sp.]|jgi:cobyrinic acid a,c-diamide synthase|nr:cobyrinate a,c-diamide synthase [Azonexus sp.]